MIKKKNYVKGTMQVCVKKKKKSMSELVEHAVPPRFAGQ